MPRPDPGDRRQRKKHQKSRRGCQTCKAKHVRCDEKRPHCSYCFKRDIPCEFSEETSPRPTHAQSLVHIPGQYDGLPKHSFVGYPIEMTEGSYSLVHLVAHYSTPKDLSPSPSLERALRTPPLLHGLLLLASYLWSWHNDNIGHIRQAFLQHRLQAMQYLNQQAQLAASDDTTISLISHLALAETVIGSEAAGEIHLKGLAELVSLRGHRPVKHHYLLIRDMAALHDQCVGDFKVRDMIELIGPFHQDEFRLFALTRVILAPIIEAMKDDPSLGELPIRIAAQVARARDPNPVCTLPVGLVRRAAYLWCYTQLFVILGRDHMDPQLPYGWHITVNVRMDLERTTPALRAANPFIRATWLFVALRGLSFVYAARETSEWDKKQKLAWKQDYRTLLRLANAELGISDFEGVKAALRGWFWRDDFRSEDSLRAIWEDVVLGQGDAFSSPLSSPSVRSGELALPHRTKAAASSPAPTVTVPAAKGGADSPVQLLALPFSGNGFYFSEAYPKWPQTREPIPRI